MQLKNTTELEGVKYVCMIGYCEDVVLLTHINVTSILTADSVREAD